MDVTHAASCSNAVSTYRNRTHLEYALIARELGKLADTLDHMIVD